jgi:curved DNA-binding protein CbpA
MLKDHYAVLGVSRGADAAAIHSAFRALARRYHPDVGSGASANKFREALEAYQILSDPDRRHQHDLDLGKSIVRAPKIAAEPLFQEHRDPFHFRRTMVFEHEDLFRELLGWLHSEFDDI